MTRERDYVVDGVLEPSREAGSAVSAQLAALGAVVRLDPMDYEPVERLQLERTAES